MYNNSNNNINKLAINTIQLIIMMNVFLMIEKPSKVNETTSNNNSMNDRNSTAVIPYNKDTSNKST